MAYPSSIDSFTTKTDNVDDVLAEHVNTIQSAIEAIETELGTDPAGSATDVKTRLIKSLGASGKLRLTDGSSLTISGGAITMTNNLHGVDTEESAASDDLTTINGATETGEVLIIWPVDSARNIVIKHNVGNIVCKGESDITLDYVSDIAILICNATTTDWVAFGISNTVIDGSGTAGRITKWTDADTLQDANMSDSISGAVLELAATLTAGRTLTIADRDTTLNGDITGGGVVATGSYTLTVPKTGTAAVGTGTADYLAQFAGANEIESSGIATADVVQKGDDYLEVTEQGSTPSTPAAGLIRLYAKTDGKFYYVDDAGTETEVGSDTDIGYIEHDAVKIGGVEVNLLNPADGELLVYNSGGSEAKFDPANLVKSGSVDVTPLFDGNTSNQWVSTEAVNWANFNFGYPAYVSKIVITAVNGDWMWADYPDDIYLFGSNTGDFTGEEIELDHYVPGGTGTYTRTYDAPRTAYRYYRMTFGRPSHGCRVNELEIYTVPAAYRFENQAMIHDATKIDGVTVDLTGITDGDALVYDGTGTKIIPGAGGGGASLTVEEADGTPSVGSVVKIKVTNGTLTDDGSGVVSLDLGSAATDGSAIHDNESNEISAITEKTTPVGADIILIEDSDDSYLKKKVKISNLPSSGGSGLFSAYVNLQDKKATTVQGGTFSSGAWRTRDLNTEIADTASLASIASNQLTLAAGTYVCHISCPAMGVNQHQARLYDTDNSVVLALGSSERADPSVTPAVSNRSFISGIFTLSASTVLEIQHHCDESSATNGFGSASYSGSDEIYTIAEFWRVA